MNQTKDTKRKHIFLVLNFINFITITIYEYLTPAMVDDLSYGSVVKDANNIFDLFGQEYSQYMNWTGRSVAHIIMRFFLYSGHKMIFNIVAGAVFTLMCLLIYLFVDHRKRYDNRLYLGIVLMIWLFQISFSDAILWETGACNYLFTSTIILGFMYLYRRMVKRQLATSKDSIEEKQLVDRAQAQQKVQSKASSQQSAIKTIAASIGFLMLGTAAGWCNENTSGAMIFFTLMMFATFLYQRKHIHRNEQVTSDHFTKAAKTTQIDEQSVYARAAKTEQIDEQSTYAIDGKTAQTDELSSNARVVKIAPQMITGLIGAVLGFAMMILAPGNFNRASMRESDTSLSQEFVARFLKIVIVYKENFMILIIALAVMIVILNYMNNHRAQLFGADAPKIEISPVYFWAFLCLITGFVLIATEPPQNRAYFGAGLFLIIAVAQAFQLIVSYKGTRGKDKTTQVASDDQTAGSGQLAQITSDMQTAQNSSSTQTAGVVVHAIMNMTATALVTAMALYMVATYITCGANMMRVKREMNQRYAYIEEQIAQGIDDFEAPLLSPEWRNKYSESAYIGDIQEDWTYWINMTYCNYYNVKVIVGIPMADWTEY